MNLQKTILIEIIAIALATAALIWLTDSYLMTLGIVILLVLVERLLVSYLEKREEEKEENDEATD
jgi:Flp pilus assembly protein TadB